MSSKDNFWLGNALSCSGLVSLEQRRTELCKKNLNKTVDNPLDALHPLIPFNEEGPQELGTVGVLPCRAM